MKKFIIILILVLFMTGCKATANFNIEQDEVTESVTINQLDSSTFQASKKWEGLPVPLYYDQELNDPLWMPNRQKESGVKYYDVTFNDTTNTINAKASFALKDHSRSSLVRNCFKYYNVIREEDKTIFSTSKGLICDFNNFNIVVKTPYTVLNNNATSVDKLNNTFIWNVRKSNNQNISVYMEIDFSKKYNETKPSKQNEPKEEDDGFKLHISKMVYLSIILGIVLAVLIALIYLYIKYKRTAKL